MEIESKSKRTLKAGTILVPKPECKYPYPKRTYIVTEKDVKKNSTIGDNWMIKP